MVAGVLIALVVLGTLASLVGGIMFLITAFRHSVGWGLAVLFLPFASIVFLFKAWQEARTAFFVQLGGLLCWLLLPVVGAATGVAVMDAAMKRTPVQQLAAQVVHEVGGSEFIPVPNPEPAADDSRAPGGYVGRSIVDVKRELGPPNAVIRQGDRTLFYFDKVELTSTNGTTITGQEKKSGR